ncbi:ABC transporter ATP-binding protein/permease [Hydrogenophaga sp.]|uniref:ABC transporter ATP-binding protein/permease n=1 Tax=Hydrogenophaga sp. TaxID=1904254 RepID=UPI0035ADC500
MTLIEKFRSFGQFARKVGHLALPYFNSQEKWKARGLLAAIVVLNLAAVYMLVLINEWNRVFYDALQNKDAPVFWRELGRFTWLAFGFIVIAVYRFYLTQLLEMRWRAWMTGHYLDRWLANKAFYRMEITRFAREDDAPPDNPDQRIAEDMNLFTSYSVSLSMGLLNALVTLVSFVGILWSLSGSFAFDWNGHTIAIPGFMVWMAVVYCVLGSVATHYIGRPLITLNYEQQRREADFRHHLVRVREYSESIALDRGEPVERQQTGLRFSEVLTNYLRLIRAQKRLTWFTTGFGQAAVVFPFIVAAPRFFSGAIQLGELMQIASAFGRVQDSLSWFVDNYDRLASWRATTDRITGFEASFTRIADEGGQAHQERSTRAEGQWHTSPLQVSLPTGTPLMATDALTVAPGDRILLRGPSGSGKSTLLRVLSGIWPWARGQVQAPAGDDDDVMFLPQRPYFPNGPLRDALAYPLPANRFSDAELREALSDALLPHLGDELDRADAWGQKLSGGEQQRLAIARVLLKRPRWLFVDEATSALDETAEHTLYRRLEDMVGERGGALVSIAHRPSVADFHHSAWVMEPESGFLAGGDRPAWRVRSQT